jgi:hypothetical protein
MKCPLASVLGEKRGPVSMKLDDLPARQAPEQSRGPNVLMWTCALAPEQSVGSPTKFGRTLCPWAGDKAPTVLDKQLPSMAGNA